MERMDRRDAGWRVLVWGGALALLALPWLAMRFTAEVDWDGTDFLVFGAMLALAGLACEVALRAWRDWRARLAGAIAFGTAFLTVWANLAVGMIGSEDNPVNLLFGGVLLVALAGAVLARQRPRAMAVAMAVTAAAQLAAGVLAVLLAGPNRGLLPTLCFAVPWALAALLFRASATHAASRSAS